MLKHNKVANLFSAKNWLLSGWGLYKKKPLIWTFMILIFTIFFIVSVNTLIGKVIAAFLTPVFSGGIYVAIYKSDNGEPIAIESLFAMFKDPQKLKQLLIIGSIGVVVIGLTYFAQKTGGILSLFITWAWWLASLFGIPLVAIKNQMAIESLKSSLDASFINLIPLFIFSVIASLLIILGALPVGLGLLIILPILFCASYFAFKTVYLDENQHNFAPDSVASHKETPNKTGNTATSTIQSSSSTVELPIRGMSKPRVDENGELELPRGVELNYFDEYMQITRIWHGLKTFAVLLTALIFNFVWISQGFVEILLSDKELLLKLFCLVFIIAGLGLIYLTIATWLNKTHIYVSKDTIEIKHQPIPWKGNRRIQANNIKQLFVKKRYRGTRNGSPRYTYKLLGITLDNKQFTLIARLDNSYHAQFIEQKIEKYLGIKNFSV